MSCARCDALARENAELREALAAWEGQEDDWRRNAAVAERIARLREVLWIGSGHGHGPGIAKLLLALIDRPGQLLGKERLLGFVARDPLNPPEIKIVAIYACQARKALDLAGFAGALITVWGQGYRLAPEAARELRARMGEAA